MPIGFTMNVDVRNDKIRVRFTELRRLYGSKKFQEPLNDEFFKTRTALAYHQAAHQKFSAIVQSLTYFIEQGKVAAADIYTRCRTARPQEPVGDRTCRPHDPVDEKTWCAARTVGIMVRMVERLDFCSACSWSECSQTCRRPRRGES